MGKSVYGQIMVERAVCHWLEVPETDCLPLIDFNIDLSIWVYLINFSIFMIIAIDKNHTITAY